MMMTKIAVTENKPPFAIFPVASVESDGPFSNSEMALQSEVEFKSDSFIFTTKHSHR